MQILFASGAEMRFLEREWVLELCAEAASGASLLE